MMSEDKFGDRINLEGLEVLAHIGVPDAERASAQRLIFNITFWPVRQAPELGDEIARAVDYAALAEEAKKFVQGRSDRLVETLADALANHLLTVFALRRVTVELQKFVLPDVRHVSVMVTRERSAG